MFRIALLLVAIAALKIEQDPTPEYDTLVDLDKKKDKKKKKAASTTTYHFNG